ncbi:hypothetical protein THIOM_000867 [Candidatus Thiomargarita nelsonii]|uniref:Uncharacterized protein n=1 Tax=Candidatus Thiomargarita nelsonii TaxID=1003181 RepID=A0A176S5Y3_9GAMM|nr:hypothetical protein THIOM_000867 [Candidatus Thiomargarita nelsonii]
MDRSADRQTNSVLISLRSPRSFGDVIPSLTMSNIPYLFSNKFVGLIYPNSYTYVPGYLTHSTEPLSLNLQPPPLSSSNVSPKSYGFDPHSRRHDARPSLGEPLVKSTNPMERRS